MAQTVKCDGLDQMGKSWSELLKRFPEEKRRVLFEVCLLYTSPSPRDS